MNKLSQLIFSFFTFFLVILILFSGNVLGGEVENKFEPDQALIEASWTKAKGLGYNPIPIYIEKEGGDIIIVRGVMISLSNNKFTYKNGDMVINVGSFSIPVSDPNAEFTLAKGEFMVMKDGKFVKQVGDVVSPKKWWHFWK